jgi:hypothetical protein
VATNNVAEYNALIEGLQMALNAGVTDIDVHFDSPVLAGHLLKEHKVKADHLRPLIERVCQLLELFSTSSLVRVPRALNARADKLANQGIDDGNRDGFRALAELIADAPPRGPAMSGPATAPDRTRDRGAFMEQSGRNRRQSVAKRAAR